MKNNNVNKNTTPQKEIFLISYECNGIMLRKGNVILFLEKSEINFLLKSLLNNLNISEMHIN
jgi:hypothetical protein